MAELSSFICPYCTEEDYFAPSKVLLLNHVRLVHSLDPNFSIQCSKEGCSKTFKNFRTYQNHCAMHDRNSPSNDHGESDADTEPTGSECELATTASTPSVAPPQLPTTTEMQPYAAKWILKTSETRSLTRKATLGIVEDVTDMVEFITQALKQQTQYILQANGVAQTTISAVDEVFSNCVTKPFEGLTSFYQQLQYYRSHFNLIVSWSTRRSMQLDIYNITSAPPLHDQVYRHIKIPVQYYKWVCIEIILLCK